MCGQVCVCVGSLGETLDEQLTVGLADVVCYRRDRSEVKEAHKNVCRGRLQERKLLVQRP